MHGNIFLDSVIESDNFGVAVLIGAVLIIIVIFLRRRRRHYTVLDLDTAFGKREFLIELESSSGPFRGHPDREEVWRYIGKVDKLTGLSPNHGSGQHYYDYTVDHIIEIQIWNYVWDQVRHLAGDREDQATWQLRQVVNDMSNLTMTPSSVNQAKGNLIAKFLRGYIRDGGRARTLTQCAEGTPFSSFKGGVILRRVIEAMKKSYQSSRENIFNTLTNYSLASALVRELNAIMNLV